MKRLLVTLLFALIGGVAGYVVPFLMLWGLALVVSWWHGDRFAGGVLAFLMIPLTPIGVLAGMALAIARVNRWYAASTGATKSESGFDPARRRLFEGIFGRAQK